MNQFDYSLRIVPESISLLNILAGGSRYAEVYSDQALRKWGLKTGERKGKLLAELDRLLEEARKAFGSDMEELHYYFCCERQADRELDPMDPLPLHGVSLANLLLLTSPFTDSDRKESLKEMQKYLAELGEEEYNKAFLDHLQGFESDNNDNPVPEHPTFTDVYDGILSMNEPDATKLKLQTLYLHRAEHIEAMMPYLERAAALLEKYRKKLEAYGRETVSYLEKALGGRSFLQYIMSLYSTEEREEYDLNCTVQVSYLHIMSLFAGWEPKEKSARGGIGVMFGEEFSLEALVLRSGTLTGEQSEILLKLLADKSKFEILSSTVSKAAYGAELAGRLGLSTATISHHTSALLQYNLLSIEKVDNRIYYSCNQETVKKLLRYLEETLLGE